MGLTGVTSLLHFQVKCIIKVPEVLCIPVVLLVKKRQYPHRIITAIKNGRVCVTVHCKAGGTSLHARYLPVLVGT